METMLTRSAIGVVNVVMWSPGCLANELLSIADAIAALNEIQTTPEQEVKLEGWRRHLPVAGFPS